MVAHLLTGGKEIRYTVPQEYTVLKMLKRPGKADMLLNMFDEVGDKFTVKEVCEATGISGYNSLKAMFSYIRNAEHIPDEHRIDVRIKDNVCIRIG